MIFYFYNTVEINHFEVMLAEISPLYNNFAQLLTPPLEGFTKLKFKVTAEGHTGGGRMQVLKK
jgi:hypothetical protein